MATTWSISPRCRIWWTRKMALQLVTKPANIFRSIACTGQGPPARRLHDDDTLIDAFIDAATQYVDGPNGFLGRALMRADLGSVSRSRSRARGQAFHRQRHLLHHAIELPLPPLIDVAGVFYLAMRRYRDRRWTPRLYGRHSQRAGADHPGVGCGRPSSLPNRRSGCGSIAAMSTQRTRRRPTTCRSRSSPPSCSWSATSTPTVKPC
jgi:hypothetical protein